MSASQHLNKEGEGSSIGLKLWELNDDQLEAELQRQLDGLPSDDEGGVEEAGDFHPPAPSASPRMHKGIDHTSEKDNADSIENIANSANSLQGNRANTSGKEDIHETFLSRSPAHENSSSNKSAWDEFMDSMTAESDHWTKYESELTILRTSMAEITATDDSAMQSTGIPEGPKEENGEQLFLTTLDSDTILKASDDMDQKNELMQGVVLGDPEKIVDDIRKKVDALMMEGDESANHDGKANPLKMDDLEYKEIAGEDELDHKECTEKDSQKTSDQERGDRVKTQKNDNAVESNKAAMLNPHELRQQALQVVGTHSSMDVLVSEAENMMAPEEREWRKSSSAQDRALMEAIDLQAEERKRMEDELIREREKMLKCQQQKELDIKVESERISAEIEEQARMAAARRAEEEAAREREQEEERIRMENLQKELEEAALEQERLIEEARREEEERKRHLKILRVRWALEERCAKTIQRNFAAHKARLLEAERLEAERLEAERRKEEERQNRLRIERNAAINIQRIARGVLHRLLTGLVRKRRTRLALFAQCLARGAAARQHVTALRICMNSASINMQRLFRGRKGRKSALMIREEKRNDDKALQIQTWWRCCLQRRNFTESRCAAIIVSSIWRSKLVRMHMFKRHLGAIALQRVVRGYACRRVVRTKSYSKSKKDDVEIARNSLWADVRADNCFYDSEAGENDEEFDQSFELFPGRMVCEVLESSEINVHTAAIPSPASNEEHHCQNRSYSSKFTEEVTRKPQKKGSRRAFPPSNEDQILCKENQRKHMAEQHQRWMAERAASMEQKVDGTSFNENGRERQSSDEHQNRSREINDFDMSGDCPSKGASMSVYAKWIDRALTWRKCFSGSQDSIALELGEPLNLSEIESVFMSAHDSFKNLRNDTVFSNEKKTTIDKGKHASIKKKKIQARDLKSSLIQMGVELRNLRESPHDISEMHQLVENLKKMKREYEALCKDITFEKNALANEEKSKERLAMEYAPEGDKKACRFVSSVECLTQLPLAQFCSSTNLECIVANCNKIGDLNGLSDSVPKLRYLSLRDNCISDDGMSGLSVLDSTSMEYLCLEMNQLKSLKILLQSGGATENSKKQSPSLLRYLLASNNSIECLLPLCYSADQPPPCQYLEKLSLYRNSVTEIPRRLVHSLRWLRHLDLGRNQLTTVSGVNFGCLQLLQGLILYENQIADDTLPALHNVLLKELWMNGNRIKKLSFYGDSSWTPSLEGLHLHDNQIRSLSLLTSIPFVKSIDLSFNQIEDIGELSNLRACPYVEVFRCNDNPVADHPDYRSRVMLAFPRLRELDGEAVSERDHAQTRKKIYGSQSHIVEAWLDQTDFSTAIKLCGSSIDWNQALRCSNSAMQVDRNPNTEQAKGEFAVWQRFEAMCRRHRTVREKLVRAHRKANVEARAVDDTAQHRSKAREMERTFQHDKEMRSLLMSQLKEHQSFDWETMHCGDRMRKHDTNSISKICTNSGHCFAVKVIDWKNSALIDGPEDGSHNLDLSHNQRNYFDISRPHSRSDVRSRSSSTASSRPSSRIIAAASAALMFQCLYRGYSVRKSMVSKMAADNAKMDGIATICEDEDEDFAGIDLENFMDFEGLDEDEFDLMEANAKGSINVATAPPVPPKTVSTSAWHDEPDANNAGTSYQRSAIQAAQNYAENKRQDNEASEVNSVVPHLGYFAASNEISYPPSPASCASSMGAGMGPQDIGLSQTPSLSGKSTPVFQRRHKQKTFAQEQRLETVANEWGFEDKKTAQLMMMRQSRFQKAKRDKKRRAKLRDPEYKYKVLMRKVREAKERENLTQTRGSVSTPGSKRSSRGSSRPSNSRSAVQRDRARHMRKRKHRLPAWAVGDSETNNISELRPESAGTNTSNPPFRVVEWGSKDILPPI